MVDTGAKALEDLDEDAADYTAKELEAKLIASRIRRLTDPDQGLLVWDKKLSGTGGYRTAQYRDIVILLRSTGEWTETLLQVLMNAGIPAYAESRMGYFNTLEVETVLAMLAVIDNPMQDIPLAAVLRSPVVGMSDKELAGMMAAYRSQADKGQDRGIYAAAMCWEGLKGFLKGWSASACWPLICRSMSSSTASMRRLGIMIMYLRCQPGLPDGQIWICW